MKNNDIENMRIKLNQSYNNQLKIFDETYRQWLNVIDVIQQITDDTQDCTVSRNLPLVKAYSDPQIILSVNNDDQYEKTLERVKKLITGLGFEEIKNEISERSKEDFCNITVYAETEEYARRLVVTVHMIPF